MKVKMLETRSGRHDRFRFFKFLEGEVYNLPETLATQLVRKGIAEATEEEVIKPTPMSNGIIRSKKKKKVDSL